MKKNKRVIISMAAVSIAAIIIIIAIVVASNNSIKPQESSKVADAMDAVADEGAFDIIENLVQDSAEDSFATQEVEPEPEPEPDLGPDLNIPAWTTDRVYFRKVPDTSADYIALLPRSTEFVELHDMGEWIHASFDGYTGYISSQYTTTEEPTNNGILICIDPGHQGKGDSTPEPNGPGSSVTKARVTSGTTGTTTGVHEYQLNLNIALQLRDELIARGYDVVMTRESHDVNISNKERAEFATSMGADITVRIHANGANSSSVNGALTMAPTSSNPYVSYLASESQRLAGDIINSYCAATGMANQGVLGTDDMTGINFCTMPVTIVEMGYMTNPSDDSNMQDPSFQSRMVSGIADGIDKYFEM